LERIVTTTAVTHLELIDLSENGFNHFRYSFHRLKCSFHFNTTECRIFVASWHLYKQQIYIFIYSDNANLAILSLLFHHELIKKIWMAALYIERCFRHCTICFDDHQTSSCIWLVLGSIHSRIFMLITFSSFSCIEAAWKADSQVHLVICSFILLDLHGDCAPMNQIFQSKCVASPVAYLVAPTWCWNLSGECQNAIVILPVWFWFFLGFMFGPALKRFGDFTRHRFFVDQNVFHRRYCINLFNECSSEYRS